MNTAIIGASGYSGGELLRLLEGHPFFVPTVISAHSQVGEKITSVHPHLHQYRHQLFSAADPEAVAECDLVFLALPPGESSRFLPSFTENQMIVDLGADFRLKSADSWEKYYGGVHAGTWTYGLPELHGAREIIASSKRIANPGCYATAIVLSSAPMLDLIEADDIVVVASSGTTGAGRSLKPNLLGSEVMGSLSSYKFGGVHQHTPEIEETLEQILGAEVKISFTPVLAPMPRGILSTVTARIKPGVSLEDLRERFESYYNQESFVHLLPLGHLPKTSSVTGSNHVDLQVALDAHTGRVIVSTALDNLGKGAAGQAIQNANLMSGLNHDAGLISSGLGV
jgi:N-acetyl-gamma-glutamyl-phosphate reductase